MIDWCFKCRGKKNAEIVKICLLTLVVALCENLDEKVQHDSMNLGLLLETV